MVVRWVRFGEGNVGIQDYVRKFIELCPGRAISHEVIVMQQRPTRIIWTPNREPTRRCARLNS